MQSQVFRPQRILVPTDFSTSAQKAVETASELAKQFQSAVYLLNIIPMLPVVDAPGYTTAIFPEQEYLQDARRYAENMLLASAEALRAEGITMITASKSAMTSSEIS